MIAATVDAWRVNEQGEPLEELQRTERERRGTVRCWMGETIEDWDCLGAVGRNHEEDNSPPTRAAPPTHPENACPKQGLALIVWERRTNQ